VLSNRRARWKLFFAAQSVGKVLDRAQYCLITSCFTNKCESRVACQVWFSVLKLWSVSREISSKLSTAGTCCVTFSIREVRLVFLLHSHE